MAYMYPKSFSFIKLWSFKTKATGGKPFEGRQDIFDPALDMINSATFAFGEVLSAIQRQLDHYILEDDVSFQEAPNGTIETATHSATLSGLDGR